MKAATHGLRGLFLSLLPVSHTQAAELVGKVLENELRASLAEMLTYRHQVEEYESLPHFAEVLTMLGRVARLQGNRTESRQLLEDAQCLFRRLAMRDSSSSSRGLFEALSELAQLGLAEGRLMESQTAALEALELMSPFTLHKDKEAYAERIEILKRIAAGEGAQPRGECSTRGVP